MLRVHLVPRADFLLVFLLTASTIAHSAEEVRLSSLDIGRTRQGWGNAQKDRSLKEQGLSIAGQVFSHGVGTHAPSYLWIDLGGSSSEFRAQVGIDDSAGEGKGSARFRVFADGKELYNSGAVRGGEKAHSVAVDVRGARHLVLIVDDAGDGITLDHADWAEATLVFQEKSPAAIDPPREEAVILTPKPAPSPRINGARIFGVRPGSPFLFAIPATGEKPITYSAKGLPQGLTLDPATGHITGSLAGAGVHEIVFEASNTHGKTSRDFKILCGETLALTPPMGWNSWYIWKGAVTQKIMSDAARSMVSTGLKDHGFTYVCIDDCWAVKPVSSTPDLGGPARDPQDRVLANARFPDMKSLTDEIHALGLKAGIYTSPGPLTCAGFEGAYQHERADAEQFVRWGFDFLKYDWCSYGRIVTNPDLAAYKKPYQVMGDILREQPRDVLLNLCQYGMGNVWEWGKEVGGHCWRTAGDLGLSYQAIPLALFQDGFDLYAKENLQKYGGPGGWNDPDYLLLGLLDNDGRISPTPLTPNEQYTHVSLWCLLAAPLFLSGDITRLDDFTVSLLSNDEVLEVNQDPAGISGRLVTRSEGLEVWAKPMADGSLAVGLFNRGEFAETVTARWADLGLSGKKTVRDLWRQQDLGSFDNEFRSSVPRHGVVLLNIGRTPQRP